MAFLWQQGRRNANIFVGSVRIAGLNRRDNELPQLSPTLVKVFLSQEK
jgi:hypothetical protein